MDGVGPTGARTYSIPIPTAAGLKFVPSVSLGYNSQTSAGWAGYGWDIQGISRITLINKNKYYHNETRGANIYGSSPVFALDGIPLVTNTQSGTMTDYPLITASGNILAAPVYNPHGFISGFSVKFPNGISATYGENTDLSHNLVEYPVVQITDIDGNRITYEYLSDTNHANPRVTSIRYGYDANDSYQAELYFYYSYTSSHLSGYHAGMILRRPFRLSSIASKDCGNTIYTLCLSYEQDDYEWLLSSVKYISGADTLRPIQFSYGPLTPSPSPSLEGLNKTDSFYLSSAFKTPTSDYVFHRGKVVSKSYFDGLLTYKSYPNYDVTQSHLFYYEFGSKYPNNLKLIFAPRLQFSSTADTTIVTGSGFQTAEVVDTDGDGVDEIVKVNCIAASGSQSTLRVTTYKCISATLPTLSTQFDILLNGTISSGSHESPYRREYYWGDFLGNGKIQLLAIAYDKNYNSQHNFSQTSYTALIDIFNETKLCDSQLFDFPLDGPKRLIVCDLDNDGQTELCYATTSGLDVYRFNSSTSSFVKETTYDNITSSLFTSSDNPCYITDLNGDGYTDFIIAPRNGTHSYWYSYLFTGSYFVSSISNITSTYSGDKFLFMDLNRDGLTDLVKINGNTMGTYRNINVSQFDSFVQASSTISGGDGIIPGSVVDPSASSGFLKVEGDSVYVYDYSEIVPERRQLSRSIDGYGRVLLNTYVYLPDNSKNWTDSNTTVNNNDGFEFKTIPLYVLQGEDAFVDESLSTKYRDRCFSYHDGVIHNWGLGFCGFSKILSFDYISGHTISTTESLDPQKRGVTTSIVTYDAQEDSRTQIITNTYDSHTTTYGKLNPRLTQSVATDSLSGITTTTTYTYGDYDLPTTVVTSRRIGSGDGQTQRVTQTYSNSVTPTKYILGSVTNKSVFTESDGDATYSWEERTVNTYDSNYHLLSSAQYVGKNGSDLPPFNPPFPDTLLLRIPPGFVYADHLVSRTRRTYDSHGNVTSEKSAPYNATTFTGDTLVYDANGRYLLSKTDALGHTTTYSNYNKFGKPTTVTDYRNRSTTYTYDSWGNLIQVTYPDGGVEQTAAAWGGDGLYTITQTATGSPETITHYDALGREIKSGVKRFNGQWQFTNKEYDSKGRLIRVSLPYRGSAPSYWNTYHYDVYDRPDSLCEASGGKTYWSYNGTSTTTIKDGIAITRTTDAMGRVVSTSDSGGTVTYTLRDDGQPLSITAPGNVVTTFTYDAYGRRTQMVDPSLGTESDSFTWNADGSSVFTHTNRNGSVTTDRDRYGRVTAVSRQGEFNTIYTYDTYGRLSAVSSTNGTGKEYTYDSYDRVSTLKETATENKWLQKTYTYSTGSVLSSIAYSSQNGAITTETYTYANGHNTGITIPGTPSGTNKTVWSLVSENDLGQPTEITTGQQCREYGFNAYGFPTYRKIEDGYIQNFSYQFDPTNGNLLYRGGYLGTAQTFSYDNLNRLVGITKGNTTRQIVYQDNGNITSIDGVGTLIYGGGTGVSPYEVTGLTPESSQPPYRQRAVTYNTFDRPSTITEGAYSAGMVYNADGDRVKMYVADTLSGPFVIRYYIGGRYEYDLFSGTERLYLGGDAYSAPMVYQRSGYGPWTLYNIGRDYQGSITSISDESDGIIAMYRYDPWGRLVDVSSGQPFAPGSEPTLFLGRGYTGHEHLPWFGLINANARLYDPLLGRFLSPDPYVQDPDFTQNYNRYSYCLNNPLKYTDESGEYIHILIGAAIGGVGGLISSWKNCHSFLDYFTAFGVGAATGALVAATGGAAAAAGGGFLASLGVIGVGTASGAINGATSDLIRQTGPDFEGIDGVDWNSVGISAAGGVAGGLGAGVGVAMSGISLPININGTPIESPILSSFIVGAVAGGAGHIAGGTTAGLLLGQSFNDAASNSLNGLWTSVWIGGAFAAASSAAYSVAKGINPLNGDILNKELIDSYDLGLENEVERIQRGELYPQFEHDGYPFRNDREYLPKGVEYKEYYLPSINGSIPGASRIVVGSDNHWYYTPDHYHTFFRFKP